MGRRVARGAVHLRRAPERVGVLHEVRAFAMGIEDGRAGEQPPQVRGRGHLSRVGPQRLEPLVERRVGPEERPRSTSPRRRRRFGAMRSARASARIPTASIPCVPLTSASPSFASRTSGSSPARASASAAGSLRRFRQHPAAADERQGQACERREVARGAERTLVPERPGRCRGSSISTIRSITPARTPECPSASTWARSSSIARASSRESSGPTAVACEATMPCCSAEAAAGSMRVSASAPKPVVTP